MKYSREEYNTRLLAEYEKEKLTTFELKRLFYNLAIDTLNSERYKNIPEGEKDIYIIMGYEACTRFLGKYRPERYDKEKDVGSPYSYFTTVIRCAVADTHVRIKKYGEIINL